MVTDLNRTIHCIINGNLETAKVFFIHADTIFREKCIEDLEKTCMPEKVRKLWKHTASQEFPKTEKEYMLFADKILTLSTIIFHNTFRYAFH